MNNFEPAVATIEDNVRTMFETHRISGTIGTGVPIAALPTALRPTTENDYARIAVEPVTPPYAQDRHKFAAMLHNAFTKEECEALIDMAERQGFMDALLRGPSGKADDLNLSGSENKAVRNNQRIPFESAELAAWLFARIKPFVPQNWCRSKPYSLHERVRIVKYKPGTYYKQHLDGYKLKDERSRSYFSFLLYLNEGYEGGGTQFHDMDDLNNIVTLTPRQGAVLVFDHGIWHGGAALTSGVKYAVKSEVMYAMSESGTV